MLKEFQRNGGGDSFVISVYLRFCRQHDRFFLYEYLYNCYYIRFILSFIKCSMLVMLRCIQLADNFFMFVIKISRALCAVIFCFVTIDVITLTLFEDSYCALCSGRHKLRTYIIVT